MKGVQDVFNENVQELNNCLNIIRLYAIRRSGAIFLGPRKDKEKPTPRHPFTVLLLLAFQTLFSSRYIICPFGGSGGSRRYDDRDDTEKTICGVTFLYIYAYIRTSMHVCARVCVFGGERSYSDIS